MDCVVAHETITSLARCNEVLAELEQDYSAGAKDVVYMRESASAEHAVDDLKRTLTEHERSCAACSLAPPPTSYHSKGFQDLLQPVQRTVIRIVGSFATNRKLSE